MLIPLLIIDGVWLFFVAKNFYMPKISHLLGAPNILAIIAFYLLYSFGFCFLLLNPSIVSGEKYLDMFLKAFIFGAVAYGTYDLTNQALLKNWPVIITIIDIFWGAFLTGIVGVISKYIINMLNK